MHMMNIKLKSLISIFYFLFSPLYCSPLAFVRHVVKALAYRRLLAAWALFCLIVN